MKVRKIRVDSFAFLVLSVVAAVGIVGMGIAFPNLLMAIQKIPVYHKRFSRAKSRLKRTLYYLESKKLITLYRGKDNDFIKITQNGQKRIVQFKLEDLTLKKPKRWDKKWRLVIFDIPEDKKLARDTLARKLKDIGFLRLQDSVWLTPYPCEEEIEYLKELYEIRPFVKLALAEKLDGQEVLEKKFQLFK